MNGTAYFLSISFATLIKALLQTMRPKQWDKNALVFIGFLFTLNQYWTPFSPTMWEWLARVLLAFVLLSAVSSAVYLLNDILDIENDRAHPTKRNRPLASGRLSKGVALAAMVVLLAVALPASFLLAPLFGYSLRKLYVVDGRTSRLLVLRDGLEQTYELGEFRARINAYADQVLEPDQLRPRLRISNHPLLRERARMQRHDLCCRAKSRVTGPA